ncbi:hypothetical protein DPEC_G00351190 [Dallia pectoralis]|uniref:Uncharacterized protein n=1 Tax=Dallia pectoralis TaxID=75939 RepID=A0ACC2F1W1_DALPE|nr:hypothetical protein DPEC_G00351190 [Dallia pectoralis]
MCQECLLIPNVLQGHSCRVKGQKTGSCHRHCALTHQRLGKCSGCTSSEDLKGYKRSMAVTRLDRRSARHLSARGEARSHKWCQKAGVEKKEHRREILDSPDCYPPSEDFLSLCLHPVLTDMMYNDNKQI